MEFAVLIALNYYYHSAGDIHFLFTVAPPINVLQPDVFLLLMQSLSGHINLEAYYAYM
jgi:hypothetical protein